MSKFPTGVLELDQQDGWTNPAMNGVRRRLTWTDIQPTAAGSFDWSLVDSQVQKKVQTGKTLGMSIALCCDAPPWLIAQGATLYTLPPQGSGNVFTIVLPWQPVVLTAIKNLTAAFGARYDGKLDYVAMGGLGCVIESFITPDPASIGLTITPAVNSWIGSCNAIIDAYAAAFPTTPFIFTASKPYDSSLAVTALQNVVGAACAKYPGRHGVMNCSLKATSTAQGYVPHALVQQFSPTNPTGLQFVTSSGGFGGHGLDGTVEETLATGVALLAHYQEVYQLDAKNPDLATAFQSAAAQMAALPPNQPAKPAPPVLFGP